METKNIVRTNLCAIVPAYITYTKIITRIITCLLFLSACNLFASNTYSLFFSHSHSLFCSQPFRKLLHLFVRSVQQGNLNHHRNLTQSWLNNYWLLPAFPYLFIYTCLQTVDCSQTRSFAFLPSLELILILSYSFFPYAYC